MSRRVGEEVVVQVDEEGDGGEGGEDEQGQVGDPRSSEQDVS